MDGSTDTRITEKELIYVTYANSFGKVECTCRFFQLKDISDASAVGVKAALEEACAELGVSNIYNQMACLCVDGAAINLGVRVSWQHFLERICLGLLLFTA